MIDNIAVLATALEDAISKRIGESRYNLWFRPHTKIHREDHQLIVGVPNRHFQEWLNKTFGAAVRSAVLEVYGEPLEVTFVIDPQLFQAARREQSRVQEQADAETDRPTGKRGSKPPADTPPSYRFEEETGPRAEQRTLFEEEKPRTSRNTAAHAGARNRRWHKLDEFVVGSCNRVAHAAAVSFVEDCGRSVNPLVLHGPVGTGKTHLLEGIYAGVRRQEPQWRVCFVAAEDFTNRFVQAMRTGKLSAFRRQFRDCDVLLVDDLNFLATKKATKEEFLHCLDSLLAEEKPVAVTVDCHPRLAEEFSPELLDRLLGGSIWGLTPPDDATRLAILKRKAIQTPSVPFPEEVLQFIAQHLCGNVRELEGALNNLRHYSKVVGKPINLALTREALADHLKHAVRVLTLADIDRAMLKVLSMESSVLQSRKKVWTISRPRMLAMFLARKHTAASYADIGRHYGNRNHSTVVAAEKNVRRWLTDEEELSLGEKRCKVRDIVKLLERELTR